MWVGYPEGGYSAADEENKERDENDTLSTCQNHSSAPRSIGMADNAPDKGSCLGQRGCFFFLSLLIPHLSSVV